MTHINGSPIHGTRDVYKMLETDVRQLTMTVVGHMGKVFQVTVTPENHH